MKQRILISILSDYLQPNFLLIKEFIGKYDQLAFITTEKMKGHGKGRALEKTLGLAENSVPRIVVVEDDYSDVKQRLEACNFSKEDEYILNITGGTKVMPIAACDFFKSFNAKFYYVPIGKNVVRDIYSDETIPLNYRLNLEEYLSLNGLRYEPDAEPSYPLSKSKDVFDEYKQKGFNRHNYRNIGYSKDLPDPKDRKYYSGQWFEDYCYWRLKKEFDLPDNAISCGAKIYREESVGNDNEIDVMFVHENELYIFECKLSITTSPGEKEREIVEKYMYKLAAIAKDYGFHPKSYILTLQNIKRKWSDSSLENIEKRMRILGINGFLDCNDFSKNEPLLSVHPTQAVSNPPAQRMEHRPIAANNPDVYHIEQPKVEIKVVGHIDLSKIGRR